MIIIVSLRIVLSFADQILKDITNRYKLLQGYKVTYIPGWDCHGMPIEQKALAEIKADHMSMAPLEIRSKGRQLTDVVFIQT